MAYRNAKNIEIIESAVFNNITGAGKPNQYRTGTDKNDLFHSSSGETMAGGKGDDHYNVWASNVVVAEKAGEGIDTVYMQFWGSYTLTDNVENLILKSRGAVGGTGNALNNLIVAGDTGATLNGKAGDDVLVGGKGADVFVVEKGTGTDTIYNYQQGWDAIQLKGFGLNSFAQIKAASSQTGGDVTINLGGGEKLVVRDVQLSSLKAADFGLLDSHQLLSTSAKWLLDKFNVALGKFDPTPITLEGASKGWNANGWYVLNNMWGTGGMKEGTDFSVNSTFSRGDMTKNVTFNWAVPLNTDYSAGIKGYPEVAFGVPPKGNYARNPSDTAVVFPVKVADLAQFTAKYDATWSGQTSGFNVSYDIWLTSKPNGDASTITNEIMVWVHKGSFGAPGDVIGTFVMEGVTGTIYNTGTYTAVLFDKDIPSGTLDVTALLAKLQTLGVVSADEYVAALSFGAEMSSGVGSLTINDLDLTVVSRGADGSLVTKEVGGDVTTVTTTKPIAAPLPPVMAPIFEGGIGKAIDDDGVVVGRKETSVGADGITTIKTYDHAERLIGTDVARVNGNTVSTHHYDAANRLTGGENVKYNDDRSITTQRYDANWKLASAEVLKNNADGSVTTSFYDNGWKLKNFDVSRTVGDKTTTQHYDANWKLLSAEAVQVQGSKTTTTHYNPDWSVKGIETVATDATGKVSIQQYDKNWKLVSAENIVANADGSVTTTHYNSKWGIAGYDIQVRDAAGVEVTTHYNRQWQVTGQDHVGGNAVDRITGGSVASDLHGGLGSDLLVSGKGATNFHFDTAIGNGDVDRISGFAVAKDAIHLDRTIFGGIKALGDLNPDAFAIGTSATSADTRIIFDKATGNLFYDADGTGSGAAVLFAQVEADKLLTAANFHVIA